MSLSPIAGLHAAVTRQNAHDEPVGGWQAQECLSVTEALRAYTYGAAYAAFWDDRMGRIAEGMLADFTVLSRKTSLSVNRVRSKTRKRDDDYRW